MLARKRADTDDSYVHLDFEKKQWDCQYKLEQIFIESTTHFLSAVEYRKLN